jgi:hypothetical protein
VIKRSGASHTDGSQVDNSRLMALTRQLVTGRHLISNSNPSVNKTVHSPATKRNTAPTRSRVDRHGRGRRCGNGRIAGFLAGVLWYSGEAKFCEGA